MKKLITIVVLISLFFTGCQPDEIDVVEVITILKSEPGTPVPTGGWALVPSNPHPDNVQYVFGPGEEMYLGLRISDRIDKEVTFSRYAFLNEDTGEAVQAGSTDDLGPFQPGQKLLVAYDSPWPVPAVPGTYQLKVYLDDTVVASAIFEVSLENIPAIPPITSLPPPKTDWEEGSPPPDGLEGREQPGPLTDDEKAEVVEIALGNQRVSEWLQGRPDYRTSEVGWYAIIWNENGEAGTWWLLEYDRVMDEGVPDFVSPYALWYPGVTIAVGEGTIYQMQIAVDLDAGKVAMVMGPYPSLSSPDRFSHMTSSTSVPPVSRQQAIEIASETLPSSIVERAEISAALHGWYWEVVFDNLNAEADELMPWPLKGPPPAPPGEPTPEPYPGIWQTVIITVDAGTADIKSAGARQEPEPGPYIDREQAIKNARNMMFQTPLEFGWGVEVTWFEKAEAEAYLRGDTWIVLFWKDGTDNRFSVTVNASTGVATGAGRG
jgi:hypothetical protein